MKINTSFWLRVFTVGVGIVLVFWFLINLTGFQALFNRLITISFPFLLGFVLAFIMNIPLSLIEAFLKRKFEEVHWWFRPLAILLSLSIFLAAVIFVLFLVLPDLFASLNYFITALPSQVEYLNRRIQEIIADHPQMIQFVTQLNFDWNEILNEISRTVRLWIGDFLSSIINYIPSLINSIFDGVISVIFAIYLLFSKEQLMRQFKKLVYALFSRDWANFLIHLGSYSYQTFKNFFSGQLLEGLITGLALYLLMIIFSFPYSLSISVVTGILTLIPFYGAILGGLFGCLLISVVSMADAAWFLLLIMVVQQVEGNIIYPNVMGNTIGIPGLWIMVVVTLGGSIFGFAGMLLSVPIFSIFYNFLAENINYSLAQSHLRIDEATRRVEKENQS